MITTVNIIAFILLTCIFVGFETFVYWPVKLNRILKTIPSAMFFSAILITVWYFLRIS
jgi:hypothetical protein